jgi:hypothetical protein
MKTVIMWLARLYNPESPMRVGKILCPKVPLIIMNIDLLKL